MKALRLFKEAAVLGAVAILPASLSWAHWQAGSKELAPYEVVLRDSRLGGEIVWVDARSQAAYDKGHVTDAILLNEEHWDSLLGGVFERWQPEKTIVVYCDPGCPSSAKVADRLRDMGIEPVYFLKGGYETWKKNQ